MNLADRDIGRLSLGEFDHSMVVSLAEMQQQRPRDDEHRFGFLLVILETQALPRIDVENLASIVLCVCPEELVAPRFFSTFCHGTDDTARTRESCLVATVESCCERAMLDFDILDPSLAEAGHLRIEWAASRMPVLATIRERFEKTKPLEGVKIGACMHVTSETATLMDTLVAGGAEVALCASNPLSTQDDVAAALVEMEIPTFAVRGEDADTFYTHMNAVLDMLPDLVFDDGADMTTILHTERIDQKVIGGMEETTTGVIRLKAMEADDVLRYPIVAVNDSDTKHLFDNRHGTGQSSLDGILRASNILFAGKRVVVAGFGDCGWGIATRAKGMGADVIVTEIDPIRAVAATMEGHRVMSGLEAAEIGEVFITATGNLHVFRAEHFAKMPDGAIIANAGHFDVELDLVALDEMAVSRRVIRDNLEEFVMSDGKRILVVAEGRLVNLGAAEGHPADVMDMSFADQALAAEWIIENKDTLLPQVYILPKELDDDVARMKLAAMSGSLEPLTEEQAEYMSSWDHGT